MYNLLYKHNKTTYKETAFKVHNGINALNIIAEKMQNILQKYDNL